MSFVPSSEVHESNQRVERKCIYTTLEKIAKFKTFSEGIARQVRPALSSAMDMEERGGGNQNMERTAALEAALKVWGGAGGDMDDIPVVGDKLSKESDLDFAARGKVDDQEEIPDYTSGAPVADEGLVTAMPVQDDVFTSPAEVAKLVNLDDKQPFTQTKNFKIFAVSAICFAVIVAVVVPLAVIRPWEDTEGTDSPTGAPTSPPTTTKFKAVGEVINTELDEAVGDLIKSSGTESSGSPFTSYTSTDEAQERARNWIINEDPLGLNGDSANLVQRYALATFYFATGGDTHWYDCSRNATVTDCNVDEQKTRFLSGENECNWFGVTCEKDDDDDVVNQIDLAYNDLNGTLPIEIGLLKSLSQLILVGNYLTGTIPESIGQLNDLTQLQMGENYFNGTLPDSLYQIQSLEVISFYYNELSGTVPERIGDMRNLKGFWMYNNGLSGQLPDTIGRLSFLTYFVISNNYFTGTIPPTFWKLNKLEYIDIGTNDLSDWVFPESFASTSIDNFQSPGNYLQGTIPDYFYDLKQLTTVRVQGNSLTGTISTKINQLTKLESIDTSYNLLNGTLPETLSELPKLKNVILRGNEFTGEIPASYANLNVTDKLFLHYNEFLTGDVHLNLCEKTVTIIVDCLVGTDSINVSVSCSCCAYCCNAVDESCEEQ